MVLTSTISQRRMAMGAMLLIALAILGTVPASGAASSHPERERYVVSGDALVMTSETCVAGASSLSCHDGETETLRTDDMGWTAFPLPGGGLVDATPHGWWVVEDNVATPADDVAAQSSTTPISVDELIALASEGGSPWPPGLFGFGWGYVLGLIGVLGMGALVVLLVLRRRREPRTLRRHIS